MDLPDFQVIFSRDTNQLFGQLQPNAMVHRIEVRAWRSSRHRALTRRVLSCFETTLGLETIARFAEGSEGRGLSLGRQFVGRSRIPIGGGNDGGSKGFADAEG